MENSMPSYYNDSIILDKKYQKIMDWIVWMHEYYIRSELNVTTRDKTLFFDTDVLIDRNTRKLIDTKNKIANSESILETLMNGKKLYLHIMFSEKGLKKTLFEEGIREAIGGNLSGLNINARDKETNDTLLIARNKLDEIRNRYGVNLINGFSIDFSQELEHLQSQLEQYWLRYKGQTEEARLVQMARILGYNKQRSLRSGANLSRAIGLWLWDYEAGQNSKPVEAVNAFQEKFYDIQQNVDYSDYFFYLNRTKACIKEQKVLPFKKEKKVIS